MSDLLVRGGTIVDGTGKPGFKADVRVRDGLIAEVAPSLKPEGEREIDASGALVTPGFIDSHTHLDGEMWWHPDFDPLPSYGTTTAIMGNCGVTIAPVTPEYRHEVVDLLCYLEDLPKNAFDASVPFRWNSSWADYRKAAQGRPTAIHLEGYAGHASIRVAAMGKAAWERTATPEENGRMAALLDEALANGALGLSTNLMDNDRQHRPVPSKIADDAEFEALLDVMARHKGKIFQVEGRFAEPQHHIADVERMARLAGPRGIRAVWLVMPMLARDTEMRANAMAMHERLHAAGIDFRPTFMHKPFSVFLNFEHSLMFEWMPAWHDMIYAPKDMRETLLSDPAWREKARHSMDHHSGPPGYPFERPDVVMLSYSETKAGPVGISLGEYARGRGQHTSDAMADWLLANGLGSIMSLKSDPLDEESVVQLLRDPRTVGCPNDTGAHLQLFEAGGQNLYLFTRYVRDTKQLSIEEAVHVLTGKHAAFFGLNDRGVIAPGKLADLNVFSLDEIDMPPEEKAYDVPGGSWRFVRRPPGIRATIVRGVPTCIAGKPTGAHPGTAFTHGG